MWLVIDTNVLVDASGQGVLDHADCALKLLRQLLAEPQFCLAIDPKEKLKREYENRINAIMYAHYWLTELNKGGRVKSSQKTPVPKGAKVKLLEARLHQEDFHLIEAALGSERIIVTRDFKSFQDNIIAILRRDLGISVLSPQEMLSRLAEKAAGQ